MNGARPFPQDAIQTAIKRLKRYVAADAAGWRGDHFLALFTEDFPALQRLCENIAADPEFVPQDLRPYFFGAKLTPLQKGEDGKGVRPIAVGTILRKTISSAIVATIKPTLPKYFSPVQFGVGFAGGTENPVHGIRLLNKLHPEWTIVSLDLTNAFNTVDRNTFLHEVQDHFPSVASWAWQCYGHPTKLIPAKGDTLEPSIKSSNMILFITIRIINQFYYYGVHGRHLPHRPYGQDHQRPRLPNHGIWKDFSESKLREV